MVQEDNLQSPPLSLKERQRQERVELILHEAQAVLAEKSYHEMSMDEVATRVGIAKGTIYLHFPSKEDMILALVKRNLTNYLQAVKHCVSQPLSARHRLQLIIERAFESERRKQSQLFMAIFASGSIRKEALDKQLSMQDYLRELANLIRTVLEEGKANHEFSSEVPTSIMLTTFLALTNHPRFDLLLGEAVVSSEELVQHIGRIYFQGIS